jgi:small subunit ribosomal protein S9
MANKQMDGEYLYGVGRRKTSAAQVRVYSAGNGAIVVNGKPMDEYFTRPRDRMAVVGPLEVAGLGNFTITAVVHGGGVTGQAGAVMQGLARALVKGNPELRSALRREGFLTRDPREKERKKPGLKRARKAPQYTKR